jgi:hypothetical protein
MGQGKLDSDAPPGALACDVGGGDAEIVEQPPRLVHLVIETSAGRFDRNHPMRGGERIDLARPGRSIFTIPVDEQHRFTFPRLDEAGAADGLAQL